MHLTIADFADDIRINGVRPQDGALSEYDKRFFTVTLESGPLAHRAGIEQANIMFERVAAGLLKAHPEASLERVDLYLPRSVVASLEAEGKIIHGPFLKWSWESDPLMTESIFAVESFPVINQYKDLWIYRPITVR